jgi:hypothetical protein
VEEILMFFGVMMSLVITAATGYGLFALIGTVSKRASGRRELPAIAPEELDDIRARLAEVDQMHGRIAELEDRLDFAERLLAQRKEPEKIAGN